MSSLDRIRAWLARIIAPEGKPPRYILQDGTILTERERQFLILTMAIKANNGELPRNLGGVLARFHAVDLMNFIDNHQPVADSAGVAPDWDQIRDALENAPRMERGPDGEWREVE